MNLSHRSYQKELLDADDIPFADIQKNMQELNTINTLLGGHAITLKGFIQLIGKRTSITVCEIGCGGGDNLAAIAKYCQANHIAIHCIGIDWKAECIAVAKTVTKLQGVSDWIVNDYAEILFDEKPDIIFSSLFCHHFTEAELQKQLQWMRANSEIGFFINDLHRHWLAYYSIAILTQLFSSSYLVKNDAKLSVARGFVKNEWIAICKHAGIQPVTIHWKWAFRYLILYRHGR